ncbi:MAG: hypothetical protein OXF79_04420, partial [Chloroflexi bacterium]|nr:hypothetical protein [Chloroflexota bacterium]
MIEGDESFSAEIAVTAPTDGAPIAAGPAATVTITDDDSATLALAITQAKVAEGGSFSLTVSLGHTPEGESTTAKTLPDDLALTVTPTFAAAADGKAAAADMADSTAKTVTLSAGSSTATVSFAIADDTADEPDETLGFRLALAPSQTLPDDVTLGTASVDATIEDGDATLVTAEDTMPTMPTSSALVSNIGQSTFTSTDVKALGRLTQLQGFTSGSHSAGYNLDSIEVVLRSTPAPAGVSVELWSAAAANRVNARIVRLTAPASVSGGANVFSAPEDTRIEANPTYFVVVRGTSGQMTDTSSDNEDAGAAQGWSIAKDAYLGANIP